MGQHTLGTIDLAAAHQDVAPENRFRWEVRNADGIVITDSAATFASEEDALAEARSILKPEVAE